MVGHGPGVYVDTDDLLVALFQLGLITKRRIRDLSCKPAFLDPEQQPGGYRTNLMPSGGTTA